MKKNASHNDKTYPPAINPLRSLCQGSEFWNYSQASAQKFPKATTDSHAINAIYYYDFEGCARHNRKARHEVPPRGHPGQRCMGCPVSMQRLNPCAGTELLTPHTQVKLFQDWHAQVLSWALRPL
eukprot:1151400-Pelagomonas_calceolata.AAC.3